MASDNFPDANGTALETHDSNWVGDAVNVEIQNNAAQNESDYATSWCAYTGSGSSDFVKCVLKAQALATATFYKSPVIRMDNTGVAAGYSIQFGTPVGSNWTTVAIFSAGSYLGQTHTGTWAIDADHTVSIQATDNGAGVDLDVTVDSVAGTQVHEVTRTYNTNLAGMVLVSNGAASDSAIDDWTDEEFSTLGAKINIEKFRIVTG